MRISASYPATDGSCPESIEIEYDAEAFPPAEDVARLIEALAKVPGSRYTPSLRVVPNGEPLADWEREILEAKAREGKT